MTSTTKTQLTKQSASTGQTVDEFIAALDHPLKQEIVALRQIILATDPQISEGIKWNAPSFRTIEDFATFHLRTQANVQIILHFGVKPRDNTNTAVAIADPESLLTWLTKDRASVTFRNLAEINAKRAAFTTILRAWIAYLSPRT